MKLKVYNERKISVTDDFWTKTFLLTLEYIFTAWQNSIIEDDSGCRGDSGDSSWRRRPRVTSFVRTRHFPTEWDSVGEGSPSGTIHCNPYFRPVSSQVQGPWTDSNLVRFLGDIKVSRGTLGDTGDDVPITGTSRGRWSGLRREGESRLRVPHWSLEGRSTRRESRV